MYFSYSYDICDGCDNVFYNQHHFCSAPSPSALQPSRSVGYKIPASQIGGSSDLYGTSGEGQQTHTDSTYQQYR